MANISFITQAHLDSIRAKVAVSSKDSSLVERTRLKELSDERATQWPNTLTAQRARKERALQEKLAAEEAERVEVDRDEAQLRAEARRIQIERANKILFDETDRVKGFHSKLLLSDVMKENEGQLVQKRGMAVLRRAQEAAFVEQQRQALEAAEAAELAKMEAARQRALAQKAIQLQQLEDLKSRILRERAEDRREGAETKLHAEEEVEELRQKEVARMARARQLTHDTMKANDVLQGFKREEVRRGVEQDIAIEAYSKKKAELTAARERKAVEKKALQDAQRQKIADAMAANYLDWHAKEDTRLALDVAQADAKAAADEAARRRHIAERNAATHLSRQAQLALKRDTLAAEKAAEGEYLDSCRVRSQELKQEEQEEGQDRLKRGKALEAFQLRQAQMKARRAAQEKIDLLQEAALVQLSLAEQEDIFQQYAAVCIQEYQLQGKSSVPLELHLRKKLDSFS
ncbi:MAG: hypothetical protein WDW38_006905 [Sanguina aurantia]